RVPVWPHAAAPTLSHVGPIARTIEDAALLLTAIAGYDIRDPAAGAAPAADLMGACAAGAAGLRIAYSSTLGYARPEPAVVRVLDTAAKSFEALGCKVEPVQAVFERDPVDIWSAEFYAAIGARL